MDRIRHGTLGRDIKPLLVADCRRNVAGVDVAVLVVRFIVDLHPVFVIRQHVGEPVAVDIFRQFGHRRVAAGHLLLGDGLELAQHVALLQFGLEERADGFLGNFCWILEFYF